VEVGQGRVGGVFSFVYPLSMCFSSLYVCFLSFRSLSFLSVSVGRPGGCRGSYRGPSADCGRSRRTVNRKGLYIISS